MIDAVFEISCFSLVISFSFSRTVFLSFAVISLDAIGVDLLLMSSDSLSGVILSFYYMKLFLLTSSICDIIILIVASLSASCEFRIETTSTSLVFDRSIEENALVASGFSVFICFSWSPIMF